MNEFGSNIKEEDVLPLLEEALDKIYDAASIMANLRFYYEDQNKKNAIISDAALKLNIVLSFISYERGKFIRGETTE